MSTVMAVPQAPETADSALTGPLLVATRGDMSSDGAMRAAMELAAAHRAQVHVIAVLEPLPVYVPGSDLGLVQPGFEEADTSVQAAVPLYGVYDFTNRFQTMPRVFRSRNDKFSASAVVRERIVYIYELQ
mgnify:CR=1 FL=1